jgi:hypothetical protein
MLLVQGRSTGSGVLEMCCFVQLLWCWWQTDEFRQNRNSAIRFFFAIRLKTNHSPPAPNYQ